MLDDDYPDYGQFTIEDYEETSEEETLPRTFKSQEELLGSTAVWIAAGFEVEEEPEHRIIQTD